MAELNSKPLPDKVPINMTKYPHLKENGLDTVPIVSGVLETLDRMVASGNHKVAEEFFGISIQELTEQLLSAVFDYEGIVSFLPDKTQGEALAALSGHALNPLYSAFSKKGLMGHDGTPATFEEKFGLKEEEFSIKHFFQGLMFYSYYCSLPDLAAHLSTNDFSLIDKEKHENIGKLIDIRPVLTYQEKHGILAGKLIPGTGLFECGSFPEGAEVCPSCSVPNTLHDLGTEVLCENCKGHFKKEA